MALTMQRESTEHIYLGVPGTVPSMGAEIALLVAGVRPTELDWNAAVIIADDTHELWAGAQATGLAGDYWLALRVGSYAGGTFDPGVGEYQTWLRLTSELEQVVRIADATVIA